MTIVQTNPELCVDLAEVRARYQRERDRRLREDGQDQYLEARDELAHFELDDPYGGPVAPREPLNDEVEVVIVGGGFGGLITAARLRQAGIDDLRIIDLAADFGGTWYWNRYPGAQCDVESYCYLPLLEETAYIPKEKYAYASEIAEHTQRIAHTFGLYDRACFQTRVNEVRWDETLNRWIVRTNRGDAMKARFVVLAPGPAGPPKLPGIPGLKDFKGPTFHTSRWNYDYTGGGPRGGLDKLHDKTVAIIGTGATAIQCVPHLAAGAKQLLVFQRTPSSVDVRANRATDPQWAGTLAPGWQRERQENFNEAVSGAPVAVDLVSDGWTDRRYLEAALEELGFPKSPAERDAVAELADVLKMNDIRARVDQMVEDPETAELLKPWYRRFCKRPTFHDEYLETFNRPNVKLIDTSASRGVERITADGLIAGGQSYAADCIVFATGFEITTGLRRKLRMDVVGENGRSLYDHWEDGWSSLHGYTTRGFPNWFYVGGLQTGLSFNFSSMVDQHACHVAYVISQAKARGAVKVQPTAAAEAEWVSNVNAMAVDMSAFRESCTPGYYNNEGQNLARDQWYAPGATAFHALLNDWRTEGQLQGLEIL
jgi:cyclohexanone monooxygenase